MTTTLVNDTPIYDKLFEELRPYWDNPIVLIDNNSRRVNRALKWHLLKMFGSHHKGDLHSMKDIVFVDSKTEPLVQLADYVAGAVHHHVDGDYDRASYQAYLQKKGKIFYL